MHLLQTKPGGYVDEDGIVSLNQSPADMVIFTSADTEIALLSDAYRSLNQHFPSLRLANLLYLKQHASIDLYLNEVAQHAKLIIVILLGGKSYWSYGVDQLVQLAAQSNLKLILVAGDDTADTELGQLSNVDIKICDKVWRYLREGGKHNISSLFRFLNSHFFGHQHHFDAPQSLPKVIVYHPRETISSIERWTGDWKTDQSTAALLFYRAHLQAGNTAAFDTLIEQMVKQNLNPLPIALNSLKDPFCLDAIETLCNQANCRIILNSTGFALSSSNNPAVIPLRINIPVLQVIFSGGNRQDWSENFRGLAPRDLAMNIALPELDGRIISRAVSFKDKLFRCEQTQSDIIAYQAITERMSFVSELAANWVKLGLKPNREKRVAIILANYPTRDGRLGNGVGLDTPQSVVNTLKSMHKNDYPVDQIPNNGTDLINRLLNFVTNDPESRDLRSCKQSMSLEDYQKYFEALPKSSKNSIIERWGSVSNDPLIRGNRIMIPGLRLGLTFIGIQPARGYHMDMAANYHDPDLLPPHSYLAFYFWLRYVYAADAIIHYGKHGNLEWLPGKSVALSELCWPDLILGPMPNIYPFIVNDPGEGAQAKRRSQAVIIDHLVPPLTRAESYGPLRALEASVDEYYQAQSLDPIRAGILRKDILDQIQDADLHTELGFGEIPSINTDELELLNRLDTYLCEIKESQIRSGLHIFGSSPVKIDRIDTLLALARLPHADAKGENKGILHALCEDLKLPEQFDPLNCELGQVWTAPKPGTLEQVDKQNWRTCGDTRERLELFAQQLLNQGLPASEKDNFPATSAVLNRIQNKLAPALDCCGEREAANLMNALQGKFIPAGPSGAPSRGCLDVLPTGRNFYSVDIRAIPTPTAWRLGLKSAHNLIERHLQDHGEFPRTLGISVWGTSTMRTGGDDIAQAFALMGVQPVWAAGSNRVIDFEILPVSVLDRPRVDVMLRISGFFRDAFPNVIRLYDTAVQAVSKLDETITDNPLRARIATDTEKLTAQGVDKNQARRRASWRVFGSKPGAYGAGLQGLIDEHCWKQQSDLAEAYLNWGGYAYGQNDSGTSARADFANRLQQLEVVVHNQDNREHDILDSDDYYQFQGGMAAAVEVLRGEQAAVYHGDHSQPDHPRIRSLNEEINRVIRARVVNPKWIDGIKKHGYKGAFELAATVDYMFAYDATCHIVDDYQYQMISEAYLFDADTLNFLQQNNPNALKEMAERLLEAIQRGLWKKPGESQAKIESIILDTENQLEQS